MSSHPAAPPEAAPAAVTFDDLFWLADRGRIEAQAWCDLCHTRTLVAVGQGDTQIADLYRSAWETHRRRAAQFECMQVLVARIGKSDVIKQELARLARAEKQKTEQTEAEAA